MDRITSFLHGVTPRPDGDLADRLSYFVTTIGLAVAAVFIFGWSFVGSPIECWFPRHWRGYWMQYARDLCFVQGTFFIPLETESTLFEIGANDGVREVGGAQQIGYYQWVPFILATQAAAFYLPVRLWRAAYKACGEIGKKIHIYVNVGMLCETADVHDAAVDGEERVAELRIVAGLLSGAFARQAHRIVGYQLIISYLMSKLLYVLNALGQFWLLRRFLAVDSLAWGLTVAASLARGDGAAWDAATETATFPRVTTCDFEVRVLSNIHRHSVQCVLPINMYNEIVFVFLWFWLAAMAALSVASLVYWTITLTLPSFRRDIIYSYMARVDSIESSAKKMAMFNAFITRRLRPDCVFILRLIASNSGDTVASSLLEILWESFLEEEKLSNSHPDWPIEKTIDD